MKFHEVDASTLLSTPTRQPKKKVSGIFSPKGGDASQRPPRPSVRRHSVASPSSPQKRVLTHSPVSVGRPIDDLSSPMQSRLKRLSMLSKKDDDEKDDADMDINMLMSPKLEQDILKKDRKMFSPIKSIKRLSVNLTRTMNESFGSLHRRDTAASDDDSVSSGDSSTASSAGEKKLSEEEVMVLLCREFSLMDDDEE